MEGIQWLSAVVFGLTASLYLLNGFMWNRGFRTGDLGDLITKKSHRSGQYMLLKIIVVTLIVFIISYILNH